MSQIHLTDSGPTPPPSVALRALVTKGGAVSTREPVLQLAAWTMGAFVLVVAAMASVGVRRDASLLDGAVRDRWMSGMVLWTCAAAVGVAFALLPPRGQVLPSLGRARLAVFVSIGLALFAAAGLVIDVPLTTHVDETQLVPSILHCQRFGLCLGAPLLALGWLLIIRRMPMSGAWIGAAVGAAAGAVGGLALHLVCSVGGTTHALFGHAGVVVLGAAIGAVSASRRRA